ncbi:MAG: hypothetical protein OXE77_01355 [Flavobacteriaceae bacterium]|nr:hypothetical protein [Flavobacteriaceae bacterium]MCY4268405.1 hypothetical protein [Flavobacteriaceae bacterium]
MKTTMKNLSVHKNSTDRQEKRNVLVFAHNCYVCHSSNSLNINNKNYPKGIPIKNEPIDGD